MGARGRIATLGGAALLAWLGAGCRFACGEFEHQTGIEWDLEGDRHPPESIDGYRLHEICGSKYGSIGWKDLLEDGVAHIMLDGTHPSSHVAITLTSSIFLDVYFPTSQLAVGATLTESDLVPTSSAYVIVTDTPVSGAFLTEATLEVLDVRPDAFWGGDAYRMRWDVTYGEPGVSAFWYTSAGEDWIAMQ